MKKRTAGVIGGLLLAVCLSVPAFAAGGTWKQDGKGWWYENTDGSYIKDAWVQESGAWYHMNGEGYMQTGWVQVNGVWYYMEPSGAMISNTTRNIDGVNYSFDGSGAWVQAAAGEFRKGSWTGNTYQNAWADYQIALPQGFVATSIPGMNMPEMEQTSHDLVISNQSAFVQLNISFTNGEMFGGLSDSTVLQVMKDYMVQEGAHISGDIASVMVGGYEYQKFTMSLENTISQDIYLRRSGNYMMWIFGTYLSGQSGQMNAAVNAISRLN